MAQVDIETSPDGVVTFWLDNPDKRNALDGAMLDALTTGLRRHGADPASRLVLLRGRHGMFCAGRDVGNLQHDVHESAPDAMAQLAPACALAEALQACAVPTVAVVTGKAVGLGLGLVVWSDFAIAEAGASFSFPEARLGIPPSMIALSLMRVLPVREATALTMRGLQLSASEARQVGLVQRLADGEPALEQECALLTHDILRASPNALRVSKALMREVAEQPYAQAFERAVRVAADALSSPDAVEGIAAFQQKRAPTWVPSVPA